jgi:hypothetical protein
MWTWWAMAGVAGVAAIAAATSLLGSGNAPAVTTVAPADPMTTPPSVAGAVAGGTPVIPAVEVAAPGVVPSSVPTPRPEALDRKVRAHRVETVAAPLLPAPSASTQPSPPRSRDALFERRQ